MPILNGLTAAFCCPKNRLLKGLINSFFKAGHLSIEIIFRKNQRWRELENIRACDLLMLVRRYNIFLGSNASRSPSPI